MKGKEKRKEVILILVVGNAITNQICIKTHTRPNSFDYRQKFSNIHEKMEKKGLLKSFGTKSGFDTKRRFIVHIPLI